MTNGEAIEYGKNKILRAEEKIRNSNDCNFIGLLQEGINFCKTSISALQERIQCVDGCEYCYGITNWVQFLDGNHPEVEFKCCPICGRKLSSVKDDNLIAYTMYVFKPSGKYYTHEDVVVDMSKYKCYEVADAIRNGEIYTGYKDMHKIFISQYDGNDSDKMLYAVPFMIRSDEG